LPLALFIFTSVSVEEQVHVRVQVQVKVPCPQDKALELKERGQEIVIFVPGAIRIIAFDLSWRRL